MVVKDFFLPLMEAWESNRYRLPDELRSERYLGRLIPRKDTLFLKLENGWLIFLALEDNANVLVLGEPDIRVVRQALKRFLDSIQGTRLTTLAPASANDYIGLLKRIGFLYEGRMRNSIVYDDELGDSVILGFLPNAKAGRRRKRRGRRGGS